MHKIFSRIQKDNLLHVINRKSEFQPRVDLAPENQFLQLACLKLGKGKSFRAHKHIWKASTNDKIITQESWVIVRGKVRCYFYDLDDQLIYETILEEGDCSMTFEGGHNYEILEDDTLVYEFKTGPYLGPHLDKVLI